MVVRRIVSQWFASCAEHTSTEVLEVMERKLLTNICNSGISNGHQLYLRGAQSEHIGLLGSNELLFYISVMQTFKSITSIDDLILVLAHLFCLEC